MGVRSLLRTNLCANPRGTVAFGPYSATGSTITTVSINDHPEDIKTANLVTYLLGYDNPGIVFMPSPTNIESGKTYSMSAWVKQIGPTVPGLPVRFAQQGVTSGGTGNTSNADVWEKVTWTHTASGLNSYGLRIGATAIGVSGSFLVTKILFQESPSVGEYFDGRSLETRDRFYKWNGMVDQSTSGEYSIVPDEWSPMGSTLSNLKQKMIETILGPTPVRTGTESIQDIKKAALEKLLGDNGLI